MEINKIVAGILVTVLIVIGIVNFTEVLYHVEQPEVAHYIIEGVDNAEMVDADKEVVAQPVEEPILVLLAAANMTKGEKVGVYPISDNSWIDVGQWPEYNKALEKF